MVDQVSLVLALLVAQYWALSPYSGTSITITPTSATTITITPSSASATVTIAPTSGTTSTSTSGHTPFPSPFAVPSQVSQPFETSTSTYNRINSFDLTEPGNRGGIGPSLFKRLQNSSGIWINLQKNIAKQRHYQLLHME